MDRATFERIKRKHGGHASWAVWAEPEGTPRSNVGDLSVLDPARNPALLGNLRNDVVMLGLNISRPFTEAFRNFHNPNRGGRDFKIRHAFSGTPFYGAYMTDIIKDIVMVDSVISCGTSVTILHGLARMWPGSSKSLRTWAVPLRL